MYILVSNVTNLHMYVRILTLLLTQSERLVTKEHTATHTHLILWPLYVGALVIKLYCSGLLPT